jgi:hypothetical protein
MVVLVQRFCSRQICHLIVRKTAALFAETLAATQPRENTHDSYWLGATIFKNLFGRNNMRITLVISVVMPLFLQDCSKRNEMPVAPVTTSPPSLELTRVPALSKSERTTAVDIDFDTISSTKSLFYMLVNSGGIDAFDLHVSTSTIEAFPSQIALVPRQGAGGLQAYPILRFTAIQGIPSSGVGAYLPLEIGTLADTISMNYKYVSSTNDTLSAQKKYSVGGLMEGAICEVYVSGKKCQDYGRTGSGVYNGQGYELFGPYTATEMETIIIANLGNVPVRLSGRSFVGRTLRDTVLQPSATLNVTDFVVGSEVLIFDSGEFLLQLAGMLWIRGTGYISIVI